MHRHLWMAMGLCVVAGCAVSQDAPSAIIAPDIRPETLRNAPRPSPRVEPTGPMSLRRALALAMGASPELAAGALAVKAAEARGVQAGLSPNPELEFELESFGGSGELRGTNGAEATIALGQLVELGGKRAKRKRLADLQSGLSAWDHRTANLDLVAEVHRTFVGVLAAQRRVALGEELLALAKEVLRGVSERVKSGKVSPLAETKARVALGVSRIQLDRARHGLAVARQRLCTTWGAKQARFGKAVGRLEAVSPPPAIDQLAARVTGNPDVARWSTEIEQRQAAVELAEAEGVPDVTVAVGIKHEGGSGDTGLVLGVGIPLPLYDRNQGGRLAARLDLLEAEQRRRAAEIRVHTGLVESCRSLRMAYAQAVALRDEVLPGARQAFDGAREGYRRGKSGYLDVLDAQRTLFEARGQYIDALADYHTGVAEVERLAGRSLDSLWRSSQSQPKEKAQ